MKYTFVKSKYDVPQNGTFEMFDVKLEGISMFYWSDNCGFCCSHFSKEEIAANHPQILPVYYAMLSAQVAADDEWNRMNQGLDDNFITVYSRDGRRDEFGVQWEEA